MLAGAQRVAMQYSPDCAVPYVAMVDAGTVESGPRPGRAGRQRSQPHSVFRIALDGRSSWKRTWKPGAEWIGFAPRRSPASRMRSGPGIRITEWEMQQFILARFREEGLVTDHGPDVAVNANASNPHYDPKQDACSEIHSGDLVLMDMWAKLAETPDNRKRLLRHHLDRLLRRRAAFCDPKRLRHRARRPRQSGRTA